MRGVNRAIIIGRVGKDPETKYTAGGAPVTSFSVATNERWRDKESGEDKEVTDWHQVVLFGKPAELAGEYIKRGSKVYIEGKSRTEKYQNRDGVTMYSTKIHANIFQVLDDQQPSTAPARQKKEEDSEPIPF